MITTYTYEDLMIEKLLKEAIIGKEERMHHSHLGSNNSSEQAKVAYKQIHPHNSIWGVVIDWPHSCKYEAHLVLFKDATSLNCMRMVAEGDTRDASSNTPKAALEHLLEGLRYDVFSRD